MTIAARHIDITTEEITCANGMPAFLAYPTGGGNSRPSSSCTSAMAW